MIWFLSLNPGISEQFFNFTINETRWLGGSRFNSSLGRPRGRTTFLSWIGTSSSRFIKVSGRGRRVLDIEYGTRTGKKYRTPNDGLGWWPRDSGQSNLMVCKSSNSNKTNKCSTSFYFNEGFHQLSTWPVGFYLSFKLVRIGNSTKLLVEQKCFKTEIPPKKISLDNEFKIITR